MADYPALPLWTDKYFGDTRHLTRDQHGAYLLLLMEAWRRPTCSLPDDDNLLARLTCSTAEEWGALRPVIMSFWKLDGRTRTWSQKALTRERDYLVKQSRLQRDRAAKRWKSTENTHAETIPDRYRIDAPTPTPTPTPTKRKDTSLRSVSADGDFEKFWSSYPPRDGSNPKEPARKAYSKAIASGATHSEIETAAKAYASHQRKEHGGKKSKFTAQAATWLNQQRWRSEEPAPAAKATAQITGPRSYTETQWRDWLSFCRDRLDWQPALGPPPFATGCLVPAHLLIERDRLMNFHDPHGHATAVLGLNRGR